MPFRVTPCEACNVVGRSSSSLLVCLNSLCLAPAALQQIGCDNEDCEHGEWFHYHCVGLQQVVSSPA